MDQRYAEIMRDLDQIVKSRSSGGRRLSYSSPVHGDEEIDPEEQLRTCRKMLARLDTPEGQQGLTTTELLSWRSMIREKIEQLQKITGDTKELELVGKSLGFGMRLGSPAARLGVQIAQNYSGRVSPEFLSWFAQNPMSA